MVGQLPPNRFRELFGVDAVLFVTIHDWSTKYLVLASNVTVRVSYRLVDTRTGLVLWQGERQTVYQSSGGGGGLAGLIVALVNALATTTVDYRPLARETNSKVFRATRQGLPAG